MPKIWCLLNIDNLANSCGFGLEYYIHGDMENAKPLLMKGVQFCDMIQKGNMAISQEVINSSQLEAWEDIQVIVKCKSPEEFRAIVGDAVFIKIDLMHMIVDDAKYSEEDIRKMQRFFISASKPYLRMAYILIRRIERQKIW